jgi:tyrosine-protein kinase Etk/Wzc
MTPNVSIPPSQPLLRSGENAHIYDYLSVILRRRKLFTLAFCVVFFSVVLYTYLMKPIYEASSTLHIKKERGQGVLVDMTFDQSNSIDAELEIIKSRTNIENVAKRLHLDWQVTKKSKGMDFKLLDFSSTAKDPSYKIEMTGAGTFTVKDDDDKLVGEGITGHLMQAKGFSLLLNDLKGEKGDSFRLKLLPLQNIAVSLKGGFKATEVGNRTNIVRISYSSPDPVLARDLVNTLVQAYLGQNIELKTEEASRTVSFIENQLKGLREELEGAEQDLETYKSSSGMFKLDSEAQELVRNLSETEKLRAEVIFQKKQVEFALDALNSAMRKGKIYSPAIMREDPLVAGLAAKLSELEIQKRTLLTDYTENHPAVRTIQGQIDEIQKKIRSTYETNLVNLTKQQGSVTHQLDIYESKLRKLPKAERDLARLTRVSNVNAGIYTFLLQKHEEARIAKATTVSNINIVDSAITPVLPIKPDKPKNLLLGFLVACIIGIGLAFFQEYLDDTIKDVEEAKRAINLPLLAVIPFIPSRAENGEAKKRLPLITRLEPKSQVSEAFRSLRTSLHFSAINRDKKIILITSTFPGEGKSIITANLSNTIAQTGVRVLVVDCDLRRSSLHDKFGVNKVPGLSEVLTGDTTFREVLHDTGIPGIDVITAGTTPPNPAELLGSEAMRQFLITHREEYDHIFIDAPPVLAVTDAPVLTTMSDIVLLVMEAGRVPVKAAQHMREMLANVQAPIAGFVMNDKTGRGETYGYYGSRYYRYGGYGRKYGHGYGYGYGYYSDDESNHRKTPQFWEKYLKFIPEKLRKEIKKRFK